ncbi:hypothetical protein [Nocardia heshunensis]
MPTNRPGDPDNPDRPIPDPAQPSESHTGPTDPAHPGAFHYPVVGESDQPASAANPTAGLPGPSGGSDPTVRFPTWPEPTIRIEAPAGGFEHHPLPPYPEDDPAPGGVPPTPVQPTLPLPADFGQEQGGEHHGPHRLAGESHGGPGAFGQAVTPGPGLDEGGFLLSGPSPYPAEPALPAPVDEPRPPRRGRIVTQEEGVTQPRPPTVAEARAREKARRRAEEQERAEEEAAEAKRRKKKRVLIGGAAVVGIAALVGGGYLVAQAWNGPEVSAMCTVVAKQGEVVPTGPGQSVTATQDNQEIVVPDNYCSDASDRGDSGIHPGFFFLAGHSYRYYYGGSGSIGHAPSGGSISAPSGATVKTKSGSTIQRGGLGAKLHGKGGS